MRPLCRLLLKSLVLSMSLGGASAVSAMPLPFREIAPQRYSGPVQCPPPPPAVTTMATEQPYQTGDKSFSKLDPQKNALRDRQLAPIKAYSAQLTKMANAYYASGGRDRASGACAMALLDAWAGQGAMLHLDGHDAYWLNILNITGWSADFAQIRGLAMPGDDPRPRIRQWLSRMAYQMRDHFDGLEAGNTVRHNNHRYWAGLAALSVASNTDDQELFNWGVASAREGLRQITPQGTLPLEIARKSKARHYSIYAADALTMAAEYAMANGVNLYAEQGGALHRLVQTSLHSAFHPEDMAGWAGAPQDPYVDKNGQIYRQGLAWVEFYDRRFPSRVPEASLIVGYRPLVNPEIGGNITMLTHR